MVITTEAESAESSLQVLDDVLKVVPQNLEGMQDQLNVPASSRITDHDDRPGERPKIDRRRVNCAPFWGAPPQDFP